MTFIGIKATAIQVIFEYTRKKATLFFKYTRRKATPLLKIYKKKGYTFLSWAPFTPTIYNHPIGTNPIWCPTKKPVMIQNLIYRTILHLLEFWMKSDLHWEVRIDFSISSTIFRADSAWNFSKISSTAVAKDISPMAMAKKAEVWGHS